MHATMNNSANESVLPLIAAAGPGLLGFLLLCMLILFLITGYSMKFALAAAGVGRFGFWKSIGVVFLTTLATMLVSGFAAMIDPDNPIVMLMAAILGIVACAMVIAMIGRCGIGKGFKTYFYNGLFGTIGMVIFAIGLAAVFIVVGPSLGIDENALAQLREGMPKPGQASSSPFGDDFEDSLGSLTNVSFSSSDSGTGIGSSDDDSLGLPAILNGPRAAAVNSSDDEVQDAFYRPIPKVKRETGRGESTNNLFQGIRENPFVK